MLGMLGIDGFLTDPCIRIYMPRQLLTSLYEWLERHHFMIIYVVLQLQHMHMSPMQYEAQHLHVR